MDERLRFVARLLEGEKMAALCREFDVSRKTGYKIFQRYKTCGLEGLTDRSRRPYRHANQLPLPIETLIVRLQAGATRAGARRRSARSSAPALSAISTPRRSAPCTRCSIATGWSAAAANDATRPRARRCPGRTTQRSVVRRLQRRVHARRSALLLSAHPHRLRQPLPLDAARPCRPPRRSMPSPCSSGVFKEFGLPRAIRTDNGVPFASPHALFGLSKLSVWWLRLGIADRAHQARPSRSKTADTSACT